MTTLWTAWYDDVLPDVPGLGPGEAAKKAIREAATEYLERSLIWEADHPAINIVANTHTYTFAPGVTGAVVAAPLNVMVNGTEIAPWTPEQNDRESTEWRLSTKTGPAGSYYCPDEDSIRLVPTPSESITGGLVMVVALTASYDATGVPDRFYQRRRHRDAIADGAKARLLMSQKKPYTNMELGKFYQSSFDAAIGSTAARRAKGNTRAPLRVATCP